APASRPSPAGRAWPDHSAHLQVPGPSVPLPPSHLLRHLHPAFRDCLEDLADLAARSGLPDLANPSFRAGQQDLLCQRRDRGCPVRGGAHENPVSPPCAHPLPPLVSLPTPLSTMRR